MNRAEVAAAEADRRLRALERQLRQIPSRYGRGGGGATPERRLLIIGGQVSSSIDIIQYAASVTPAAVYDPDVDASYPAGLGRAWLIEDGLAVSRVLVRHNVAGWRVPFVAGQAPRTLTTVTITYSGTDMTCWVPSW